MHPYCTVDYFLAEYQMFADEDKEHIAEVILDASVFVRDLKNGDIAADTLASVTRDVTARMLKDRWRQGVDDSSWGAVPFRGPNTDSSELLTPYLGNKYLTQWDRIRLGIDETDTVACYVNPEPEAWNG